MRYNMEFLTIQYLGEETHRTVAGIMLVTGHWIGLPSQWSVGYRHFSDKVSCQMQLIEKDIWNSMYSLNIFEFALYVLQWLTSFNINLSISCDDESNELKKTSKYTINQNRCHHYLFVLFIKTKFWELMADN